MMLCGSLRKELSESVSHDDYLGRQISQRIIKIIQLLFIVVIYISLLQIEIFLVQELIKTAQQIDVGRRYLGDQTVYEFTAQGGGTFYDIEVLRSEDNSVTKSQIIGYLLDLEAVNKERPFRAVLILFIGYFHLRFITVIVLKPEIYAVFVLAELYEIPVLDLLILHGQGRQ